MHEYLNEFRTWLQKDKGLKFNSVKSYVNNTAIWLNTDMTMFDYLETIDNAKSYISKRTGLKWFCKFMAACHPELPQPADPQPSRRKRTRTDIPPYADVITVQSILHYLKDNARPVDHMAASLQYLLGLRIGEVEAAVIHSYRFMAAVFTVAPGKGGKSRHLPVSKELRVILEGYLQNTRSRQAPINCEALLVSPSGVPFKANRFYYAALREAYKVNGVVMREAHVGHWLRHMCGTHLLEAGAGLLDIKDFLGHMSVGTTEIYLQISPNRLRHITENLSELRREANVEAKRERLQVV